MSAARLLANIVLMTGLKLVGLLLSVLLIVLQTAAFGTTPAADAYFTVRRFVLSAIAMAFEATNQLAVPEFVREVQSGGHAGMRRALLRFGIPIVGLLSLIALALWVFAEPVVRLLAPGFDDDRLAQAAELLGVVALCLPLTGIAALAGAFNFARRRFGLTTLARLLPRVTLLPVLLVMGAAVTPLSLSWALVIGVALMALMIVVQGLRDLRRMDRGGLSMPRRSTTPRRAAAVTINAAAQMAMGWADAALASLTGLGGVTIMFVAQRLLSAAPGAVNSAVNSAYYTEYSHAAGAEAGARPTIAAAVRISLFLTLPLVAFVMIAATPLITFLLERGAFTAEDTAASADLVRFLAPLLLVNAVLAAFLPATLADDGLPLVRVFLWFSAVALLIRFAAGLPLGALFGLKGVASSILLASTGSALVLARALHRRHSALGTRHDLREIALMIGAAVVAAAVSTLVWWQLDLGDLALLCAHALTVGLLFLAGCALLRLPEMQALLALLRRRRR
ncbi:oligosaccharide flippase family protein [Ruegeria pomeroyi]|uniref:lipid II flippase MurJ n=1 Tax=Ruegeria pomeroyi TaxID=89184 RepID=UPI001F3F3F34|nr:lipid II flippase MurJ [Ruegeria pomeroyi]MCE8510797.1 oligosaccharide flippase family protein [Ruegeria pomeroyi]